MLTDKTLNKPKNHQPSLDPLRSKVLGQTAAHKTGKSVSTQHHTHCRDLQGTPATREGVDTSCGDGQLRLGVGNPES